MNCEHYISELKSFFAAHQTDDAADMKRYLRNQFEFYGVKTPKRTLLSRQFIQKNGAPQGDDLKKVIALCWVSPHREIQYFVRDLLSPKQLKQLDESFFEVFETCITSKSWWDTVDFIAPKFMFALFSRFPAQTHTRTTDWITSDNIWLQRSAIIFQLNAKEKTDIDLLFSHILHRADSTEFFVQKGAGWALRQYARINPALVKQFVEDNRLSALTAREAIKNYDSIKN